MACIKAPLIPIPTLPVGISITPPQLPPLPGIDFTLCCHINIPPIPLPNLPGLTLTANLLQPINAILTEVNTFLDQLQINCPLE